MKNFAAILAVVSILTAAKHILDAKESVVSESGNSKAIIVCSSQRRNMSKINLKWEHMAENTQKMVNHFRREEKFTDVAVEIEGRKIQAHRLILSVGSKYFCELFEKQPAAVPLIGNVSF